MNYKSISDLNSDIKKSLHKIPKDVSLVVGIPRSGLLAANLISLYLHLPLTDIDGLLRGEILSAGFRGKNLGKEAFKGKILIVDDSLCTGGSLKEAKEKLKPLADKNLDLLFCCVYVSPNNIDLTDIALVSLEMPRVFEWNIFHHKLLENACVDIDGVLCIDPEECENDDGEQYIKFLLTAKPYITPKVKIATLVTTRLEKYRKQTEQWLRENGILYDELVMLDLPDKETRIRLNNRAEYKAEEFKKRRNAKIFIESEQDQAQKIFELSGKHVYCVDTNEMYTKDTYKDLAIKARRRSMRLVRRLKKAFYKRIIARFL